MGTEAVDLLKPDVSPERVVRVDPFQVEEEEEEEEDDLEALRLAALRSMKPRKPQGYQLQPHPRRSNLLTIVVDEEEPALAKVALKSLPPGKAKAVNSFSGVDKQDQKVDKFSRYKDYEKSSDEDEEEEEEDEVLKLDASAEVDELTQLLDDMEDKVLKDPRAAKGPSSSGTRRARTPPHASSRRRSKSRSPLRRSSPSPPSKRRRHPRPRSSSPKPSHKNGKSKSLPPPPPSSPGHKRGEESSRKRPLPRLSTPEREKRLARQKKFENPLNVSEGRKKVISLKNIKEDTVHPPLRSLSPPHTHRHTVNPIEDSISLSVEDTLDMFDEEDAQQRASKRKHHGSLSASTSPNAQQSSRVMDLRVQLHKKRQQKMGSRSQGASAASGGGGVSSTYIEEQRMVSLDEEDSLENAVLESSSENEDAYNGNSLSKKPRRILIREVTNTTESTTPKEASPLSNKKKTQRPSIMSRLGEPVTDKQRSPTPEVLLVLGKSPKKKKEKKDKRKKSKKDKKERKRGSSGSKSRGSRQSSSGGEEEDHLSDDDEELFKFFEEEKKEDASGGSSDPSSSARPDELMKRMEKKNQARRKRLKEIEEDKKLHT